MLALKQSAEKWTFYRREGGEGGSGTIGIVALMCEKTIGIEDNGQWAGLKD